MAAPPLGLIVSIVGVFVDARKAYAIAGAVIGLFTCVIPLLLAMFMSFD